MLQGHNEQEYKTLHPQLRHELSGKEEKEAIAVNGKVEATPIKKQESINKHQRHYQRH